MHTNLDVILSSTPAFLTAVLWWIFGYQLFFIRTSSSALITFWNNNMRFGCFSLLIVAACFLLFDSVQCDGWIFFAFWAGFICLGVLYLLDLGGYSIEPE